MRYKREDFFVPGTTIVQPINSRNGIPGIYGLYGSYRALSNFHQAPIRIWGMTFHTSEAAYMAGKTTVKEEQLALTQIVEGKEAKRFGQRVTLREDWEEVKVEVMEQVLWAKFRQNATLEQMLLDTDDWYIEETNWWNDNFWGVCDTDLGQNNLGKTLMRVRNGIRWEISMIQGDNKCQC
jgi:ribA/ribD-fused uncharacterized protein